jgi:GT2 family glycosyltransferase
MTQGKTKPGVCILIVSYNGRDLLEPCIASLLPQTSSRPDTHILVVDNNSKDQTLPWLQEHHPTVHTLASSTNLGFAGGNNLGWKHAHQTWPDLDYLILLNQDTVVRPGWLHELVDFMQKNPHCGMAQSKILLHPQIDLINTDGNESHFLGFGFPGRYRCPDSPANHPPFEIGFASGASAIVRTSNIKTFDTLFPEHFFLYLEDTHLSWRLRLAGHPSWSVPQSQVEHKYTFTAIDKQYFHLEKNRLWLLLTFYKKRTLLLILPAIVFMELGQWVFALFKGLVMQRARAYGYILARLDKITHDRRSLQATRACSDREFTRPFVGAINTSQLDSPLVKFIASPVLNLYWHIARKLICW